MTLASELLSISPPEAQWHTTVLNDVMPHRVGCCCTLCSMDRAYSQTKATTGAPSVKPPDSLLLRLLLLEFALGQAFLHLHISGFAEIPPQKPERINEKEGLALTGRRSRRR